MRLFEYQAKEIFAQYGIGIPKGKLAGSKEEIKKCVEEIGVPCVLKAQVLSGGRGKDGLIIVARKGIEAIEQGVWLFECGKNIKKVLIEQLIDIQKEIYISITVDPQKAKAMLMACSQGGMDIETIAATMPEKIIRELIDINTGVQPFQINDFVYRLGFQGDVSKQIGHIVEAMYGIFEKYDAELVEINPLFITQEGSVIAGDGKLVIDDNSMFRQPMFKKEREYFDSDMEYQAALEGIPYLQFDGNISLMCAGAGLANTVYDIVNYEGGRVANYLEFGGPNYMKAQKAMDLCLKNKSDVILIVTFGTIARADVMAQGIADAIRNLKIDRPIVTCIRGTGEEKAMEILQSEGLICISDTEEAVKFAVEIASGRKRQ